MASNAHPGFAAIQNKIAAKEGVGRKAAGAILANATRKASPQAKAKNPNLKRVDALKRRASKLKEGSAAEEKGESAAYEKTEDEPRQ